MKATLRESHMKNHLMIELGLFALCLYSTIPLQAAQDNPLLIPEVAQVPVIDGKSNDSCWTAITWQPLDQVWIPYGTPSDTTEFQGRYKVVWSAESNLLYFLVQVTDDTLVDGFINNKTADIYNFDIIEVFLDEDRSGGLHVFDGVDSIGREWGTNAENAFAYHIYSDIPESGSTNASRWVYDLDGPSWEKVIKRNYANHFPKYILRREGNTLTWEFSLIVYNDHYEYEHPEGTRAQLISGKKMGLSLAYCDNDNPDEKPKERDSFFGSVHVPAKAYNDHWMNADWFGPAELVGLPDN